MGSILGTQDGGYAEQAILFARGFGLEKEAADRKPAYNLSGQLYLASSGFLLLSVPNAFVRGVFSAMDEPGVELPPSGPDGQLQAHITVMRPDELAMIGGADKVTERGKRFAYTLGRLYSVDPDDWAGVSRVWYVKVHSPELQQLRRSYGLSSLPDDGNKEFHITVAVRRRGVLGTNGTAKSS